jgi:hypothetical protein
MREREREREREKERERERYLRKFIQEKITSQPQPDN